MSLLINSGYCFTLALMILLLPLSWIMPAVLGAFIHEMCHYLAILACSRKSAQVGLHSFAARMNLPEMGRGKELFCALAGPVGGLCLVLLAPWFPRLALCAGAQSLYNLLPVYPLDGGRALRCLLHLFFAPSVAEIAEALITWITIGALILLSIYGAFYLDLGFLPLLASVILVFRANDAKMPCKAMQFEVQ